MNYHLAAIYTRFRNKIFGDFRERVFEGLRKKTVGFISIMTRLGNSIGVVDRRVIIAFGDSTTARRPKHGLGRVYCERLGDILKAHGVKSLMINSGAGGSHSGRAIDNSVCGKYHALDRLDKEVQRYRPSIVIVQFGLNDSWVDSDDPSCPSRIPLDRFAENINVIIKALKKDGARVIMMTPNQLGGFYPDWRKQRLFLYTEAVRRAAENHCLPLVDVWKLYDEYAAVKGQTVDDLLLDSMHPNDRGHQLVAASLAKSIISN